MLETPKAALPDIGIVERISTMDNQQEILCAYLAGLVDGEGCISVGIPQGKRGAGFNTVCTITNTNGRLIDFLVEKLTLLEIPVHVQWYNHKQNARPYAQLSIRRHGGIKKFLSLVAPYLVAKRQQAELMLELVESRLAKFNSVKRNSQAWQASERERQIVTTIRALNQKGKRLLNDYMSDAKLGEDIVSSAAKVAV